MDKSRDIPKSESATKAAFESTIQKVQTLLSEWDDPNDLMKAYVDIRQTIKTQLDELRNQRQCEGEQLMKEAEGITGFMQAQGMLPHSVRPSLDDSEMNEILARSNQKVYPVKP